MSENIKEIIQTIVLVAGVVAIVFCVGDCAIKQTRGSDKVNIERINKIKKLDAKCKVYYD